MTELNGMKLYIGPMIFQVAEVEDLTWEGPEETQKLNGLIQHSKLSISVEADLPREVQLVTIWHEVLHGILEQGGVIDQDEGVVTMLGYAVLDFIRKNKPLITETWNEQQDAVGR